MGAVGGVYRRIAVNAKAVNGVTVNASTRYQSPSCEHRTTVDPGPASSSAVVMA